MTIQLSDGSEYDGGDFDSYDIRPDMDKTSRGMMKNKGTAFIFPSTLHHKVNPVTRGVRKSLVAWFFGPRWR